ncbi:MAG: hypothetical protein J6386_17675 [Candidatus Synoicihabitans palmerolidicus]|nr:hypothetical protein [Candidatus Synoicihabitans palmerolidicus]
MTTSVDVQRCNDPQWFPDQADTVFTASLYLLQLEAGEQWSTAHVSQVNDLLERFGSRLPQTIRRWGQFVRAQVRWSATKDPAAINELQELAANHALYDYRRGWSACAAGLYMAETGPRAAVEYLIDYAAFDCDAQTTINGEIASRILASATSEVLPRWLDNLRVLHPAEFHAIVTPALLRAVIESDSVEIDQIEPFTAALKAALTADELTYSDTTIRINLATEALDNVIEVRGGWREAYALIDALCAQPPLDWMDPGPADKWASSIEIYRFFNTQQAERDPHAMFNAGLNQLRFHRENYAASANALNWIMWILRRNSQGNEALIDRLGEVALSFTGAKPQCVWETPPRRSRICPS